jgi:DNA-directed RNA polymerase specialized sigma24 family protein
MSAAEESPGIERLLHHSEWLAALARRLVRDGASADDLVQETWLAALRHPPAAGRSVRAWLTTVARRLARGQGRHCDGAEDPAPADARARTTPWRVWSRSAAWPG